MFIHKQFNHCPSCHKDTYGVVSVGHKDYALACTSCNFEEMRTLPFLRKEIVYLDQFAISEMMKTLNPAAKGHDAVIKDEFWIELYKRLDVLHMMQLAVYPSSCTHGHESAACDSFEDLKRVYDHLSSGQRFQTLHSIKRIQYAKIASDWIDGKQTPTYKPDRRDAFHQSVDCWEGDLYIRFPQRYLRDFAPANAKAKAETAAGVKRVIDNCRSEEITDFDTLLEREKQAMPRAMALAAEKRLKSFVSMYQGATPWDPFELTGPLVLDFLDNAQRAFENRGLSLEEAQKEARGLVKNVELWFHVPFYRIMCMLWAAVERKAAAGQKRDPSAGMSDDVEAISVLLPYCDAMFLDRECHTLLTEEPLKTRINYGTRLFSRRNQQEFLEYLDGIKESVSDDHLQALEDIYGSRSPSPNLRLFAC